MSGQGATPEERYLVERLRRAGARLQSFPDRPGQAADALASYDGGGDPTALDTALAHIGSTRGWLALMGDDLAATEKQLREYAAADFIQRRIDQAP